MPMRHVTFRQLRVFETIARHLSFTRAAEELFLTQPTVSMQMKQLADVVGVPLFEQIGKRIHLTEAGHALYKTCQEIFGSVERFEMAMADHKGLKQGRLRLAVITTAEYFAPRVLGSFCQRYPGIDISLKVANREHMLERLSENLDDLYILGQPPENVDTHFRAFMENPLVIVARSDHPLAEQKDIPLQRIAEEPFIMRELGSGIRQATQQLFDAHHVAVRVRMELGSNEAIKQSIAAGLGLSTLSLHTLALDWSSGEFAILDVQKFPILRHWYIVYPRDKKLSVVAQAFHDYLIDEGRLVAELPFTSSTVAWPVKVLDALQLGKAYKPGLAAC